MPYSELPKSYLERFKEVYKENGVKGILKGIPEVIDQGNIKGNLKALNKYTLDKLKYRNSMAHPLKIIEIDPAEVKYMQKPRFKGSLFTYTVDGDWDINKLENYQEYREIKKKKKGKRFIVPIRTYPRYKSFKKHFIEGVPWEETKFYKKRIKKIEEKGPRPKKRTGTKPKLKKRLKGLDKLYQNIEKHGYKTQQEIIEKRKNNEEIPLKQEKLIFRPAAKNEIRINIGRNGQLIFDEGRHRFIIAKLLGIPKIPVRVLARHKKWQKLRKEIATKNKENLTEKSKKHLNHPDMKDLTKNQT
ncbi:hypothetical protein [Methanonatronarchaeum sp. AMET-Sl]|uniref:hypothetical protein n=1 Tax=Methanonatronarchaeum sp. AMET-Sl TaxID=3037654 RepID=UPI00244DA10F|nr:hypothetical protein [Methanonatronarchaeum sp. AMET-Sl]WGI17611.1 hypothetical protein QEN48_00975 [Methanonatronarchaeum sp. AMET-Sl]